MKAIARINITHKGKIYQQRKQYILDEKEYKDIENSFSSPYISKVFDVKEEKNVIKEKQVIKNIEAVKVQEIAKVQEVETIEVVETTLFSKKRKNAERN
jgi:hypothetical protein